jgi:short-subunit dehydrogenase
MSTSKTALITGASAGLGAEFARQLAARGYHLILTARRQERLEELAAGLEKESGTTCEVLVADLSQTDGIQTVAECIARQSELHLLVNNAGFGLRDTFSKSDPALLNDMLHVHFSAAVLLSRSALPGMISRHQGDIINVASMAGFIPLRSVLYGSSKAFLISFSQALDLELTGTGVHVQALCPGFTHTEFHDAQGTASFINHSIPRILWLTSEQVVRHSLRDLPHHKVISIPGLQYQIIGFLMRSRLTFGIVRAFAQILFAGRRPY